MQLRIAHLYPDLLNIYGDLGNITVLKRRAEWRGIDATITNVSIGDELKWIDIDMFFIGGGQDRQQALVTADLLAHKASKLLAARDDGRVILAVCGGYQLLGKEYRAADGERIAGIGLFDHTTIHPGAQLPRCTGNVLVRCDWDVQHRQLVGFENHGGRTVLGPAAVPLGTVLYGAGNNGRDGGEGARSARAYGTYVHGSLLPKNPWFTDHLMLEALRRTNGAGLQLPSLDDSLEVAAHEAIVRRMRSGQVPVAALHRKR